MSARAALPVVAGAIERDGKLLLCRRPMHKARGGGFEFPGGKIEAGESSAEALARELREELGVEIRAGETLAQTVHAYPELTVRLTLLRAEIVSGVPQLLEHTEFRWASPEEALALDLCPADRTLLKKILENRYDV